MDVESDFDQPLMMRLYYLSRATFKILFRLTLAILCKGVKEEQKSEVQINLKKKQYQNSEFLV